MTIEDRGKLIISASVQGFLERYGMTVAEDKNSTSAEHLKGSVKEALGKLTGDPRVEAEGRRQKKDADTPKAGRSKPTGPERG